MLVETNSHRTPGPDITVACPTCGHETVAISYLLTESVSILGKGPFLGTSNTWVQCTRCGERQLSQVLPQRLVTLNAWQLKQLVGGTVPPRAKQLAIAAIALVLVPIVGAVVGVLAVLDTLKITGWPRTASRVALGLTLATNLALAALGISRLIPAKHERARAHIAIASPLLTKPHAGGRIQLALAHLTPGLTAALGEGPTGNTPKPNAVPPLAANAPKLMPAPSPTTDVLADLPAFNEAPIPAATPTPVPTPAPAPAPEPPKPALAATPGDDAAGVAAEPQPLPEEVAAAKPNPPPVAEPKPIPKPAPAAPADDPGGVAAEPQPLPGEVPPPPKPGTPTPPG